MVVIALVAVIAGFGMSFSMSSIARSNTQNERDMLVSLLTQARARSIANINEAAHGVYVDTANQRYVIYTKNGGCTNATTTATNIPFLTPATWSGPLDRCFGQLSVRVSGAQTGTTTITLANSSYSISVNSIGRIDW
jgi:Tfp pilus assembly protein FimT